MKKELNKGSSAIYNALLKYGYSNFSLEILEYCNKIELIKREQYHMDLLKPEYNILKKAGSNIGFKHSEATKAKIKTKLCLINGGINHSFYGKNHSYETRKKIGESLKSKKVGLETKLKMSSRSRGISIKVFDKFNNLINVFPTMISAAKGIGISIGTLSRILNKNIKDKFIYRNYIFKYEVKDNKVWIYDSNYNLIGVKDNIKKASK
jgi:group I intron endonuclease